MVSRFSPEQEFFTQERCFIVEMHHSEEDRNCSIARARVEPGETTQLHALRGVDERYVVIAGEGVMEVGGRTLGPVRPLDVVLVPAGAWQRIANVGQGDLIFLCVCTPRFVVDAYLNLEISSAPQGSVGGAADPSALSS